MTREKLENWLMDVNGRFRRNDVPPKQRPLLALRELSIKLNVPIRLDGELANAVFTWFEANTQEGSHAIGSLFTGTYYFDACFWPVEVPVGYGTFTLNALDCLKMREPLKSQLAGNNSEMWNYAVYWVDCLDFALGSDDLRTDSTTPSLGEAFLRNGEHDIESTVAQLSESRPNQKALQSSRMAVEIYLKALLILKTGKSEQFVKSISHNLEKAMDECFSATGVKEFTVLRPMLNIFPDISARYTGSPVPVRRLWEAYCVAQATASTVVRILSGRDTRPQLVAQPDGEIHHS